MNFYTKFFSALILCLCFATYAIASDKEVREELLKKLCLSSNILRQETTLSINDFIKEHPPQTSFTSCFYYLKDGGKETRALDLFFESILHLSTSQEEEYLIKENYLEIINMARSHASKNLYANEVLLLFSDNVNEVNKAAETLIEKEHPNSLQEALYLYIDNPDQEYRFFNRQILIDKLSNSQDIYTRYISYLFFEEIDLIPFSKEELERLLKNHPDFHIQLAAQLFKEGELEKSTFQATLYALRGEDQEKLDAAFALASESSYWKGGYLAEQILQTINDLQSLMNIPENEKKYISTIKLIKFNPAFYRILNGERHVFSTYFPEFSQLYSPEQVFDLLTFDQQDRLKKDLVFVNDSYKKFKDFTPMSVDEKISSSTVALLTKDESMVIQGIDILLNIGDIDKRALEVIRNLYNYYSDVVSKSQLSRIGVNLYRYYLDGSLNAEELLIDLCRVETSFTSELNCKEFLQKSEIAKLSLYSSKLFNEGLNKQDLNQIKQIKTSLNHSKGFKNFILGAHFSNSDRLKSKEYFESSLKYGYLPATSELMEYHLLLNNFQEAFNLGLEMMTHIDDLNAYRFSELVENKGIQDLEDFYITGGEEVWDDIAFELGNGVAAMNKVWDNSLNPALQEENIYKLDLIKRKKFSFIREKEYLEYRIELALLLGDLGEARAYKNSLDNYCRNKDCNSNSFSKQFLWLEDNKNDLEESLRNEAQDFIEGYEIDFDEWSWLVSDAELNNLESLFFKIIRTIHAEGRSQEYWNNYLTYYMSIALNNKSCSTFSETLRFMKEYESTRPVDFYHFEMYVVALTWGSFCGYFEKEDLKIVSDLSESLLQFYLSSGQTSVAARGIRLLNSLQGFDDNIYDLGLALLGKLKSGTLYSVVVGKQASFSDQAKTHSFYKFYSDFLYKRYSDNLIDREEFLNLMLTIHSLSGFSSISQTFFQEKVISISRNDSLKNSIANLKGIRRSLDNSLINGIEVSFEDFDSMLLKISKEKKNIREILKAFKGELYPERILEDLQAILLPKDLLIFYVEGIENVYKIEISKEATLISKIKEEGFSSWRQIKMKLASFENLSNIPSGLISLSDVLLPNSKLSYSNLSFFPSSSLLGFPFKSLVLRENKSLDPEEIFKTNSYLIQNTNIRTVPSVFNFIESSNQPVVSSKKQKLLALGDPVFNTKEISNFDFLLNKYRSSQGAIDSISALDQLPESRNEILTISEYFSESKIFLGKDASVNKLLSLNLEEFSHIVIATHAIAPFEILNIPTSGLVLSPSKNDLGLLTPFLIAQLSLDAEVVALSACSTSSAEFSDKEIYTGLVKSFMEAGTKSVLFTDWKVETNASSLVTRNTMKNLIEGLDKDEALSKSIRYYLQTNEGIYRHPSFWASFDIFY